MSTPVVFAENLVEAIDRRRIVLASQIEAADLHFLRGELVARDRHLVFRVGDVFRLGKFGHELIEDRQRFFRRALVAHRVRHLVEITHAGDVVGVRRIRRIRIETDVALRRADGVLVIGLLILRVERLEKAFSRPLGRGMALLEFGEFLGRALVILRLQLGETLIVKSLRRNILGDLGFVFLAAAEKAGERTTKMADSLKAGAPAAARP